MPELESLSWLSSAEVVFALIAVGTVLLLVEIASPGGWIAGIAGVALLALAGLALLSLPFSWIGLALIAIGLGLFLFEFTGRIGLRGVWGRRCNQLRCRRPASVRRQDRHGIRRVRRKR